MNNEEDKLNKIPKIVSIIVIYFLFAILIIEYFNFTSNSVKSILEKAPNSNFAILLNAINEFWVDSLLVGCGLAGIAHVIAGIYFTLVQYKKGNMKTNDFNYRILATFTIVTLISFIFVLTMAATKPNNSSIVFNLISYIGSTFIFMYTMFFKKKKEDKS